MIETLKNINNNSKNNNKKKRDRSKPFNPNRQFLKDALKAYQKKGGEVSKLKPLSEVHEKANAHYRSEAKFNNYFSEGN